MTIHLVVNVCQICFPFVSCSGIGNGGWVGGWVGGGVGALPPGQGVGCKHETGVASFREEVNRESHRSRHHPVKTISSIRWSFDWAVYEFCQLHFAIWQLGAIDHSIGAINHRMVSTNWVWGCLSVPVILVIVLIYTYMYLNILIIYGTLTNFRC